MLTESFRVGISFVACHSGPAKYQRDFQTFRNNTVIITEAAAVDLLHLPPKGPFCYHLCKMSILGQLLIYRSFSEPPHSTQTINQLNIL